MESGINMKSERVEDKNRRGNYKEGPVPTQKPVVLLVNDYPAILRLISRVLEIEGYRVVTAHDGAAVLNLFAEKKPLQLVILGREATEQSIEVCRRIRQFSDMPIIIFTVHDETYDRARSLEAGANDFITLPIGMAEFAARVKAVLRCSRFPKVNVQPE